MQHVATRRFKSVMGIIVPSLREGPLAAQAEWITIKVSLNMYLKKKILFRPFRVACCFNQQRCHRYSELVTLNLKS